MTDQAMVPLNPEPGTVDLWDRTETRSVLNIVPPAMQAHLLDAGAKRGDLFGLDELTLYKTLRSENKMPSPTDNRLRLQFWLEYDNAQSEMRQMQMSRVYSGVCTKQLFFQHVVARPEKMAWMLTPPVSYTTKIEEALQFGLDRMRDILAMEVETGGRVNVKLAELQAKIVAMLDQRSKGSVTQRIEQKNMNLNISTSDKQVAAAALEGSMDELTKRIKDLERRERVALNLPESHEPIEVESTVEK